MTTPEVSQEAQMLYYATCENCDWRSDFSPDRDVAVAQAWRHKYSMIEAFSFPHRTHQMRCLFISEPDRP